MDTNEESKYEDGRDGETEDAVDTNEESKDGDDGETESSLWFIQRAHSLMKIGENNGERKEAVDANEESKDKDGEDDETKEAVDTNEKSEDEDGENNETEEALYIDADRKGAETEEVVDIDDERKDEDGEDDETSIQKNLLKNSGFPELRRGTRRGRSMLKTFYVVLRWKILVNPESFFSFKKRYDCAEGYYKSIYYIEIKRTNDVKGI